MPGDAALCPTCGKPVASDPALAQRLLCNGAFQLLRHLGSGGMSTLYLGARTRTGELCVVKELIPPSEWTARPQFEEMVEKEAHLLQRLSKEPIAVPRYYDAFMDSGIFYIVLEFVPGQNLAQYMQARNEPLPISEVLTYVQQVVDILLVIHNMQPAPLIHGDVKPTNLIRRPDGSIVLLDFGVAQLGSAHPASGAGHAAFGTPGYTPVEQWEGHPTPASDIFALGATMHQLLTGRDPTAPFARLSHVSVADLSTLTSFPALTTLRPDAPLLLETLLTEMLRRRVPLRPSAAALQARLHSLAPLLAS